ncbi:hypothetical protein ACPZ19_29210 [Amycolatopsis lurida]|nr:hypothetical protein [Amycolatopsis sp. YIM 10]QFU91270.1 hypothetical protein YIM_30520 [Amycolatopsis sp. YIM 10]
MHGVLAHQGGWDEIMLFAGPVAIIVLLVVLARRQAPPPEEDDEHDE